MSLASLISRLARTLPPLVALGCIGLLCVQQLAQPRRALEGVEATLSRAVGDVVYPGLVEGEATVAESDVQAPSTEGEAEAHTGRNSSLARISRFSPATSTRRAVRPDGPRLRSARYVFGAAPRAPPA